MKEITSIIANTLPDSTGVKFTKNVLRKFRDQANSAFPCLPVKTNKGLEVGRVKEAEIVGGMLRFKMEIDADLIDKRWEHFLVPDGNMLASEIQGKFRVITSATIKGMSIVKFPTDLTMKPVRFDD